MSVQIGSLTVDRVRYDREGNVLYLHRADPVAPTSMPLTLKVRTRTWRTPIRVTQGYVLQTFELGS
ncbi:MAG: hypothetical protein M3022_03930 [Actinomycetota bacterium]|nr:hypothetical protein [Actinomycetota bacterium]